MQERGRCRSTSPRPEPLQSRGYALHDEGAAPVAGGEHPAARAGSLIGRRIALIALGMRALDFRETVEGPGGDAGAIVVERAVPVARLRPAEVP